MTSKLGVYWSVMHRRPQDYDYFKRLQPSVFKIMDGGPPDYQFAREHLPNSLVIARDWAMSEQHSDMLKDPIATGKRHAQEWDKHQARLGFDRAKTLILGINEPRIWEPGVPEALRQYTIALCEEATKLGLRVGAMQLSVGWPNNDGPDTPPNWSQWHGVDNAIRANNGALVCHEYWADNGPLENWGWWAGRVLKCPWQVPIVIGECGVDIYVKDGSVNHAQRGWLGRMEPERYAQELAEYAARMNEDSRFVGCAVFAADFASHEWFSFDIEPAYQAILATPLPDAPAQPPATVHIPAVSTGQPPVAAPVPVLTHPIQDPALRIISQRFGANPQDYARFGLAGHNGLDFAVSVGTMIHAVDDGVVAEALNDTDGYGLYVKLRHLWGESLYAHLDGWYVEQGITVKRDMIIGQSGNSGNSTGPHLHFAMRVNPYTRGGAFDGYSDPAPYLDKIPASPTSKHEVVKVIALAALEFDVDSDLLLSLIWAESSFDPKAVNINSGASGLGQIMPPTWAEWSAKVGASDIFNPADNARVTAAYLAWCVETANGEPYGVLAYNYGIGNFLNGVAAPKETIAYANKVLHGRDLLKAVGA